MKEPINIAQSPYSYIVAPGASIRSVAEDLARLKIIEKPDILIFEARRLGKASLIKAGEYELTTGMTPMQVLDLIVSGKVIQHSLRIGEGKTFDEIMQVIDSHPKIEHVLRGLESTVIMQKLGYPDQHPEGRFYPDTYFFTAKTSDLALLKRAYLKMDKVLSSLWKSRDANLPYKNPYEALIMASIVEKETGTASERPMIAGVFIRRIQKGMLLQTDPTVIYALGKNFDGNLRRNDLRVDNPYNTYRYVGLPPSPITTPSEAALAAALHPLAGDELYFVAKGNGSHHFSKTLLEHNNAVREYQIHRKKVVN